MDSFEKFGLSQETLKALRDKGFEAPTPIQEKTIPVMLGGNKDIVGQAQTGTGKTAAFGIPIIELINNKTKDVKALVLTPTRELAIQVAEEINSLKGKRKMSVIPVYGGQSIDLQLRHLKKGVDIVVGTPGRIIDHIERGSLKLDKISFLVLDEADEMLNMGFIDDVETIINETSKEKQTLLFSATMPPEIVRIAQKYMRGYEFIKVTGSQLTVSATEQIYFEVSEENKFEALCRIVDIEENFYGLIFCRTKIDVDTVANHLMERGYYADALHGDISQAQREKILVKFKRKQINVLVATDVAARGIDVQDLTHVINYSLPYEAESYVHRIGRTGRAGKEGVAITFVTPDEYRRLQFIIRETKTEIRKAKLPGIRDVIQTKKEKIKASLDNILQQYLKTEYTDLAEEILKNNNPRDMLAAVLQYSFPDVLDETKYSEIEEAVVDSKGKTRLFVGQGRIDGLTKLKLIDIIRENCKIKKEKIRDIQILDKFSFITLPFHEAEIVMGYFKKKGKKGSLYITKAKK